MSRIEASPSALPPISPVPMQLIGVVGSRKLRLKLTDCERNEGFPSSFHNQLSCS